MSTPEHLPSKECLQVCPYCRQPAREDGCIFHSADCAGMEKVNMTRLQLYILRSGVAQSETKPVPVGWRCKNEFGYWRFTSVKPDITRYPFWEPLFAQPPSKTLTETGERL